MDKIESIIDERIIKGTDDAFYTLSLEDVRNKYRKWVEKIPRVTPFYAVKCNDDERVLKTLADLGAGFDCASKKEIAQILDLNVNKNRIVYTHTAKQVSHLKFSAEKKIKKLTFDSAEELIKIQRYHADAEVVLRIRFDAATSVINLGLKFGCDPVTEAPELIKLCKEMKMNLVGISFHVGSSTRDYIIFEQALAKVRELFDFAETVGFDLNFVDIGGGFIGHDLCHLDHYAVSINSGIDKFFADPKITIISEPGRYFVDSAFKIVTQVILKKSGVDGHIQYFVNEGIYMSFLISFIYEEKLNFSIIRKSLNKFNLKEKKLSTIWGCTCNSKDKILGNQLMEELSENDWVIFHNMGAYTNTVSTSFNGFSIGEIVIID